MSDPTIRLSTCCPDGRCPECGYVGDGGYRFTSVAPCGCTVCVICEPVHLRALLTEALRQLSERTNADIQRGISYVLSIRCKRHWNVPQMNATEARGGECAACAVENTNQVLATIRTHEMEAEERAKRMKEERDSALARVEFQVTELRSRDEALARVVQERDAAIREAASHYDCHGGPGTTTEPCGACVSCVMRRAEKAERERDEARSFGEKAAREYNALLSSRVVSCVYCGHAYPTGTPASGPDTLLTEHIKACPKHPMRAAEDRADRAEALLAEARTEHRDISERYIAASSARIRAEAMLRECYRVVGDTDSSVLARTKLLAKIREALGD